MKKTFPVLAIIALLIFLQGCSSPEEKAAEYLANAEQLFEQNELEKAAIEYRNALQINQNMPDAWYGLARIHERKQEWKAAYGSLSRIRETNPEHLGARIMLAQLLLASGEIEQALEDANFVVEKAPDDPRGHALMAAVQFRLADFESAQQSVERSLELDPGNSEAILVKARILISQEKYDESIAVLDAALANNPFSVSMYLMKMQAYSALGDRDGIEGVLEALIEKFPDNAGFQGALVRHYIGSGNLDRAEAQLQGLVEKDPGNADAKITLAQFKRQYRSVEDAIALLQDYIEQDESEYRFRFALGELHMANQQPEKAAEVYQGIVADDGLQPSGLEARNRLALIRLRAGERDEAVRLVDEVLAEDANNENGLIFEAGLRIAEGKHDDAIINLRTVLRDNPTSIRALGLIGQAYAATNSSQLALEAYAKAFEVRPQIPAITNAYARLLMRNNNTSQADEVLQRSIAAGNENAETLKLLAQVKLALGEWDKAEELAQRLRGLEGEEAVSQQVLGLVYQGREQQGDSIEAFKRAHELAPNASQPVVSLVRSYVRDGKIDEARSFLNSLIEENGENVTAYLLLGQIDLAQNNPDGAADNFNKVIEVNPKAELGYRSLTSVYFRQNKLAEAEKVLEAGLQELPDSVSMTVNLASIYQSRQEIDRAIGLYEDLLQRKPDLIVVKNNLASLLTDFRTDKASHQRARSLSRDFRDASLAQFRDTYAWAAVKTGEGLEEAVSILEGIVREHEDVSIYQYHLGEAYRKKGDTTRARITLEKAIELAQPGSPIATMAEKSLELVTQ